MQEGVPGPGRGALQIACQHTDLVDEQRQDAAACPPDGTVEQVVEGRRGAAVPFQPDGSRGQGEADPGEFLGPCRVEAGQFGDQRGDELGVGLAFGADRDDDGAAVGRHPLHQPGQGRLAVPAVADQDRAGVRQRGEDLVGFPHPADDVLDGHDAADDEGHGPRFPVHHQSVRQNRCTSELLYVMVVVSDRGWNFCNVFY